MSPPDGDVHPGVESRGVYVYDPVANVWTENPLAMPKEIGQCPSGFYSPELNAHFVHVAGDSADNGIMWVYRYKKEADRTTEGAYRLDAAEVQSLRGVIEGTYLYRARGTSPQKLRVALESRPE